MSEKTEQSRASSIDFDSALETLEDWYHVPAVGAIFAFMLWVRVQAWENFTQNGEVYFSGNDAYYHFRQVMYTVDHWPATMPFDPWTHFPKGTVVGQFGTLFDQLVATAALIIGLGSPSQNTVAMTLLFAPAVFGALLAIPTYFIGKRLGGRLGGVFAAVILALLPGYFLQRSLAGAADHNGAEPLFQSLAVLGTMVALAVAEREKPIYEQFVDRDVAGLRRVVGWSVLAGVATAMYMWMWPPGVLLVGIFGVFYLVKLSSDYYTGTSPDHVAVVAAVSMTTTAVLMLVPLDTLSFSPSRFSILQPLFSLAVGAGAVFLAWLARQWDDRGFDAASYPLAVFSVLLVGLAATTVVLPEFWGMLTTNLMRFVGFSAGAATRTIGEAQPFLSRMDRYGVSMAGVIFLEYGLAFFTALVAAGWILLRPHLASGDTRRVGGAALAVVVVAMLFIAPGLPASIGNIFGVGGQLTALGIVGITLTAVAVTGEHDAEQLLVVVWGAFITSAAFTQVRFNYYLVVPVVVLNAYFLHLVLGAVDLAKPASKVEDVSWYQVGTVVMVLLVVLVPVAAPVAADAFDNESAGGATSPITVSNARGQQVPLQSVIDAGASFGPGAVTKWDDALEWMKSHTPKEGAYGNGGNTSQMDYYGTYSQTDNFNYPDGSYGVMSWWDYGHWITVEANRIPHANPFQQGANTAANFLLAQNETVARNVLQGIQEDDAKMRYVAVDYQMVMPTEKYGAPVVFYDGVHNFSQRDLYTHSVLARYQDGRPVAAQLMQSTRFGVQTLKTQSYYESMMVRLYRYHGSAQQVKPKVVDWRETRANRPWFDVSNRRTWIKTFPNMSAAETYVANDSTSQIGGVQNAPPEYVEALEHYRLVGVSDNSLVPGNILFAGEFGSQFMPTWVKLFERVEGATVTGTAPANTTVTASVTMNMSQMTSQRDGSHPTFEYTQRVQVGADGEFTMTLPYSTTGYENWGPKNGHTNVSVRAAGPYTFSTANMTADDGLTTYTYRDTASVPEAAVVGESNETISVDLERQTVDVPDGKPGNETGDNTTSSASLSGAVTASGDASDAGSRAGPSGLDASAAALPAVGALAVGTRVRA
ncbi:oligosaccharyl transferase, archaeosortase A system-associated [Halobacterium zhouii]|uniref:oligosaccharyl transferase, archaeosortase A system-associated n=1 Tax=Halobacterium zhouii TaxID=2902624 RepID=UPI001E531ED4|nr:oligosaccharyl transferase, archaeosortase A system-associated [Halobacterium zhouii]